MVRRLTIALLALALTACASPEFKPLVFAPEVRLQDPLPGKAIVYLLRVPNDGDTVAVMFGQRKMAVLPPSTFTAVSVEPGTHEVVATVGAVSAPPATLTVRAGERRFLYTAVPTRSISSIGFVAGSPTGVIPLVVPTVVPVGARAWKECRELDAQGLMSTSRVVPPEPGAG